MDDASPPSASAHAETATGAATLLQALVLGAGAGGGFPQWNSASAACRAGFDGRVAAASQAGIAVSGDGGRHWFLINASPDLRQQILRNPQLWPAEAPLRNSPIAGVVLTNADVDAVAGLLCLRERARLDLWAHPRVLEVLAANPIFDVLDPALVPRRALALDAPQPLPLPDGGPSGGGPSGGRPSGLTVTPFAVPGKLPLYLEAGAAQLFGEAGEALGLEITGPSGKRLVYLANVARFTPALLARLDGADLLFCDGTLWQDDEMIRRGEGAKTAARMGHVAMDGPEGAIAALAPLAIGRRIFIHINNTNPVLLPGSPERAAALAAGWEIAADGMELTL